MLHCTAVPDGPTSPRWNARQTADLALLFREGNTDAEIAALLNRSERAVTLKRHELGLRHYSRNTRPVIDEELSRREKALRESLEIVLLLARRRRDDEIESVAIEALKAG